MLFFRHFFLFPVCYATHLPNDSCECEKARPLAAKRGWYHSEQAGQRHLFRAGTVASLSAWDSGVERTLWDKGLKNSEHIRAKSVAHCVADTNFFPHSCFKLSKEKKEERELLFYFIFFVERKRGLGVSDFFCGSQVSQGVEIV